jgi:hydrogenase maturation protein HypF
VPGEQRSAIEIRVRGRVQGVGFRPHVYRLAKELGLSGEVSNDAEGVFIRAAGSAAAFAAFLERMESERPPLARIESIETQACDPALVADATGSRVEGCAFRIAPSAGGAARTEVAPDAVVCGACAREVLDPAARRFRYPFTTCTHCGPRLSIVQGVPYDRAQTTMAVFPLCAACDAEYRDPADRRFHAEPTACHVCGPKARLVRFDGQGGIADADADDLTRLVADGAIVAIKGLGGFQLACDATQPAAVARLRARKRRDAKPFALMARDLDVIRRYCLVTTEEESALTSPEGPIVLLCRGGPESLPDAVAPGLGMIGFMLPTTPLHLLVLHGTARPLVMTSGNLSEEPQVIADAEAPARLAGIADYALLNDRAIANRVDDSVARSMDGRMRVFRRARGYAPSAMRLPAGFEGAPSLLAYGGELKSTFCLLEGGRAILSQHQGDLEDSATFADYQKNQALYATLFDHSPRALVADRHPDYLSTKLARERALAEGLPLLAVQHHHAHVASCLAENGWPIDGARVLGIVLDGLGLGDDDTLWGGELLLADYRAFERAGTFKRVAMIGGESASREPWRNLYAHLVAEMGWGPFSETYGSLEVHRLLAEKPRRVLDGMLRSGTNVPTASSCGRLFDAFAAAVGIAFERQAYEGDAGSRLEASVAADDLAYPFAITEPATGVPYLEPLPMWRAALGDLLAGTSVGVMASRFHRGLARALVGMACGLRGARPRARFDTVALSGGCFQNRVLFEEVCRGLRDQGLRVLTQAHVPPNDGGLALGQAAVAAARLVRG